MLNVFLTVDTEVWPATPQWRESRLAHDIGRDIFGETSSGSFGLPYQIEQLNRYGLKASFFVESLFAGAVGFEPLRRIVRAIQGGGHDVQLHLHTEWLDKLADSPLPGRAGQHLKDFSLDEQSILISTGLANLRECGVDEVQAFRAGNYGANLDTLRALAQNGIFIDTSYNACYRSSSCGIETPDLLLQPRRLAGVLEFPISFFCDYPGHYRHAQLCACSSSEMENALLDAWKSNWHCFVLIFHSFELIKRGRGTPDGVVIKRFERLCQYLAENPDKFRVSTFADIEPDPVPLRSSPAPLRSPLRFTAQRFAEQLAGRIL